MAKELQVKEFSALPVADDGKTLLYADGEVKQSRKNLSEMLTDEVNNKLDTTAFSTVSGSFLTAHQVIPSGKWENVSNVVIANSATWGSETDWTDDINAASAYAYEQAVAQIPPPFDPTFLSGEIDKKLDKAIYEADSGKFLTAHQSLEGYATQEWVSGQGYITGVDLSNYYTKNETSGAEELANAFANIPLGDVEVNELVHSNSAEWNNVSNKLDTTSFSDVSGDFLTNEDLDGYATETLVQNVSGDITASIQTNYYPNNNPSGFITGVDLTPYQTISGMTAYQSAGDYATTNYVNEEIGKIGSYVTATLVSGEPDVQNPSNKKIYLTKIDGATEPDLYKEWIYTETSAWECIGDTSMNLSDYVTDSTFNTTTNYLSGAIDYVSANAKDIYPVRATYGASITFDKTYNEIYSAINDNKLPIVYFTNYDKRVKCTYTFGGNESNAPLYFTSNYITNPVPNEKALYSYTLELLSDNTVTLTQTILNQTKLDNVYDTVNTNSASWGGGSTTGEYVPLSATACSIGNNTATDPQSFSQGVNNQCLGTESFTQGYGNSAYNGSFAQGRECYASNYSISQGSNCSAIEVASQAFGRGTVISSVGMAIGQYNKTYTDVAFVIGDGDASYRSDLFVINKYGNVSAKSGYFYDKDGKVGGGTTYKNGYLISIDNSHKLNFINYYCSADSAKYNVAIGYYTTAVGSASVAMGKSSSAFGNYSHSEGDQTRASGDYSHAEGIYTTANGAYAHTEGYYTSASNSGAHAEGDRTKACGVCSHAEGTYTTANGNYSHAEGYNTSANGQASHAEGSFTKAIGDYSLAVGESTSAKSYCSFAGGSYTIANYSNQFVIGKYNGNKENTLFEVGNGDYNNRTNALEVYKDGKVSGGDFVAGGVSLSSLTPVTLTFRTVGE